VKARTTSGAVRRTAGVGAGAVAAAIAGTLLTGTAHADPWWIHPIYNYRFNDCLQEPSPGQVTHGDCDLGSGPYNSWKGWAFGQKNAYDQFPVYNQASGGCLSVAGGNVVWGAKVTVERCDPNRQDQLWGRFDYRHLTLETKGYCLSANSFNAEARVITCTPGPPRPQDTSQYWSHSDANP